MKRRLLIAAIFLLAGAVVNVAVAWGQVVFQDSERITWTEVGTHIEKGPDQSYLFLRREPFGFPCWSFTRDRLIAVRTTVESPWIGTSRKTYVPLRPIDQAIDIYLADAINNAGQIATSGGEDKEGAALLLTPIQNCPGDLDCDGFVGITDFLDLLVVWGPQPSHPADLDGDGIIGIVDFLMLLGNWGPCP